MKVNELTDPLVTGVSRVLTHTPLGAYADAESAATGCDSPFVRSLDGTSATHGAARSQSSLRDHLVAGQRIRLRTSSCGHDGLASSLGPDTPRAVRERKSWAGNQRHHGADVPRFQGGFIWDWRDKALVRRVNGRDAWAYGNEFNGGVGPDGYAYGAKENPQMCLNGVVGPDLTPKPGAWEVKKVQAPVQFDCEGLVTLREGRLKVRNRYLVLSLDPLALHWEVAVNGDVVQHGILAMPSVAPGEEAEARIPLVVLENSAGSEIWLNVNAVQTAPTPWSDAGHCVAWEQFALHDVSEMSGCVSAPAGAPPRSAPRLAEDRAGVSVHAGTVRCSY